MSTPTSERKPLALIVSEFGDFDGRKAVPEGWTHLPAALSSKLDTALRQSAEYLWIPHARYLAKMVRDHQNGRWEKIYTGIVVHDDRAEEVARLAEALVGGCVMFQDERVWGQDAPIRHLVNIKPKRIRIEWIEDEGGNLLTDSGPVKAPPGQ